MDASTLKPFYDRITRRRRLHGHNGRRIGAVSKGHLFFPAVVSGFEGPTQKLERAPQQAAELALPHPLPSSHLINPFVAGEPGRRGQVLLSRVKIGVLVGSIARWSLQGGEKSVSYKKPPSRQPPLACTVHRPLQIPLRAKIRRREWGVVMELLARLRGTGLLGSCLLLMILTKRSQGRVVINAGLAR